MKTLRFAVPVLVFASLFIVSAVFAQSDTSDAIDFASALETIRTEYGEDVFILDADFETDPDDDDFNCWDFDLLLDNSTGLPPFKSE